MRSDAKIQGEVRLAGAALGLGGTSEPLDSGARGERPAGDAEQGLPLRFEREALPHLRSLYGTACRLARNTADAEDLVQETYLRAFRAFASFERGTNIRAWLYTILHRVRADGFRRAGRAPKTVALAEDERAVPPPQEALASGGEEIARALERLPEVYRCAVVLRDVEDFSYAEISRIQSVPIGTVMSRIHRGRALLRGALTGQGRPARGAERAVE